MHEWIDQLRNIRDSGERAIVLTVAGVRGSAPREIGAKMLVCKNDTLGTIGGGQLEHTCTEIACGLLRNEKGNVRLLRRFPLGANCGQCCGGVVDILFEDCGAGSGWFDALLRVFYAGQAALIVTRLAGDDACKQVVAANEIDRLRVGAETDCHMIEAGRRALADGKAQLLKSGARHRFLLEPVTASRFDVAIFGAGHVGTATVAMLATLDCNIRWIDNRRHVLPENMPANVLTIRTDTPEREVAAMPASAFYLAMTHSHPLDYEICRHVLNRRDFAYCGLIGSLSKRRRFTRKLRLDGVASIDRLTCPIGVSGISGKKPAMIAISVAAELLQIHESIRQSVADGSGDNVHCIKSR